MVIRLWLLMMCLALPCGAMAEQAPVVQASFLSARSPLFDTRTGALGEEPGPEQRRGAASLFAGQGRGSLLAPYPARPAQRARARTRAGMTPMRFGVGTPVERIRQIIGQAEAGRHGYDAVQHGATVRPGKQPTQMTISEIYSWIKQTPGQPHAIGRYQFIPGTLRRLVKLLGVPETAVFSAKIQDQLADILLAEAGLQKLHRGDIKRTTFMNNMAKIWAGLPTSSGQSYYHGYAGNRATMTWADFETEMARIFPG